MENGSGHMSWQAMRWEILNRPGAGEAYKAARGRFELGEAARSSGEAPGCRSVTDPQPPETAS